MPSFFKYTKAKKAQFDLTQKSNIILSHVEPVRTRGCTVWETGLQNIINTNNAHESFIPGVVFFLAYKHKNGIMNTHITKSKNGTRY